MPETVLFKSESVRSREEIAEYLHSVADSLAAGGEVTLSSATESVAIDPPERAEFEVKVEREGHPDNPEKSIELEIEWHEGAEGDADGDLRIE
ncbi:hypothetical protein JCM30237_21370 [Halolamina litorea]|uniref:Amphi-Trp domain-containing protein n=1 Tax=Halolamina litorea TaxID=1515593 RepID=A0ABD6BNY3_9EURY|nr:amphi-Trp domain-containing protein [Halolamina litorea]